MTVIKVKPSEKIILDLIGVDAGNASESGIEVQPSTPYVTDTYPIPDYDTIEPEVVSQITNGTVGFLVPLIRRMGPMFGSLLPVSLLHHLQYF